MQSNSSFPARPLMGIGACLAGNAVRYNGEANEPNQQVREICSQFELAPFCPEVGIGLGVPRPPIHLVGDPGEIRVLDVASHQEDYTAALRRYALEVLERAPNMCGYILVTGSPSCGNQQVKRFSTDGEHIASDATGMFARALREADPLLPCADDGQLNDATYSSHFIVRARAYHDWKKLKNKGMSFNSLDKLLQQYRSHVHNLDPDALSVLDALVKSNSTAPPLPALEREFISTLMGALSTGFTP